MESNETISKRLRRIAKLYTNSLAGLLTGFDINRYFDVLLTLSTQLQPVTQKKLAELMHVDKSRIVSILDYLIQKEYTCVEKNPNDRREHFILLTAKGLDSIPVIKSAILKNDKLMISGLKESEFIKCLTTLSIIEKNLQKAI